MSNPNPSHLNVYSQVKDVYNSPVLGSTIKARSSFAVDSDDIQLNERARGWSCNKMPFKTILNGGFILRIIDLESREEGGKAYKVVDQYGHIYDLRERVMLDIFKRKTISPGGEISGTFRFVRDGSQNLLVPEDSEWVEKANRMSNKTPIKKPIPYTLYSTKRENEFFFCLPKGYCLAFGHSFLSNDRTKANPLASAYRTDLPKTIYLSSIQFDLGPDPAVGLLHALMLGDKNYTRWTIGTLEPLAHLVDRYEEFKKLEANPSLLKLPNTWSN